MLYRFSRMLFRTYFAVVNRWQVIGKENIPQDGAVLLVSNHISLFDPPLVGCALDRQVHFMAKAELFEVPVLKQLITDFGAFPVKRGAGDRAALRTVFKLLEDGNVMGMFPEGTRSKSGEVEEAHSGAAVFALRSNATVIPVGIMGSYKLFRRIRIVIGKPIDMTSYRGVKTSKETIAQVTHLIMNHVKDLVKEGS